MYKNCQKHKGVWKMQREELQSKRKENEMFVSEGGVGALHWQRRAVGALR